MDELQAQIVVVQLQHTNRKLPYTMEPARIDESVVFATVKLGVQEEHDRAIIIIENLTFCRSLRPLLDPPDCFPLPI